MTAARQHKIVVAVVSVAVLAALAVAGAASGARSSDKKDRDAPTAPTNVRVTAATPTSVSLAWEHSTDNEGVASYEVEIRNRRMLAFGTTYTASALECGQSIGVSIVALDSSENRSLSTEATVSTAACLDVSAPTPPTGFRQAATTVDAVMLKWHESSDDVGVVAYGIYRYQLPVQSTSEPSAVLSGLTCGSAFEYQVDSVDAAGNRSERRSAWVETARCARALSPSPSPPPPPPAPSPSPPADTTPPTQPGNLSVASVSSTSLSLGWVASSDNVGVASYRVYVDGTGVLDTTQPGGTVSALACGTAFTFEVDAADAAGNRSTRARVTASTSPCSDTEAPTAPANITASSRTATSIVLTWSASSDNVGVSGYGVYRGGALVGQGLATTWIFSGLTCNTNYTLAVDAQDAAGNRSGKTTVMVATTACPDISPPSTPTGLAASNVTQSGLSLTWTASTDNVGVARYDVYKNGTRMGSVTATSSTQGGLECGTSYRFDVEAVDAAGNRSGRAGLSATTSGCAAPPPAPARIGLGSQFHCNWSFYTDSDRLTVLDKLAAAGASWVRIDTSWAGIEASGKGDRNAWYLRMTDFCVHEASKRGINVLMTLWMTPAWANGGQGERVPPTNPQDYADFAQWAAARWKGAVQAYEVWNEPDPSQSFWQGSTAQLVALMKAAYPSIKTGDPGALVVFPGPASNDDVWIDQVYAAGAKGSFDVMATHPYQGLADAPPEHPDDGNKWWFSHLPAVRAVMVKYGDGDKQVWFTEFGWSQHDNWAGIANWQRGVTPSQQADYLTRAVAYAQANYPYVTAMIWYKERARPGSTDVHYEGYGLLNADLSERPVYVAFRQLAGAD